MNSQIIQEIFNIKSSSVDDMKNLLKQIKSCKDETLFSEIRKLEKELKEIKKAKKYWLVWEEKEEHFDKETVWKLPVLEEVKNYNIKQNDLENNILIQWDNYHTLSVLNYTHAGKIDVIYIDPPYNTWNNDFIYNDKIVDKEDKFRHSKWLSFMNKRLRLAKNLLSEKWVILFSIDENEFAQLKLLCDEILWEENFIWNIAIVNNLKWRSDDKHLATAHEFVFIYSKNINFINLNWTKITDEKIKEYNLEDKFWKYKKIWLRKTWKWWKREDRPNMFYPIFFNENKKEISLEYKEWFIEILPLDKSWKEWRWRWWKDTFYKKYNTEIIIEKTRNWNFTVYSKMRLEDWEEIRTLKVKSIFIDPKYDSWKWTNDIKNIFWDSIFTNPKPISLIKDIMEISSSQNSTILDFFAWSWTTWHAVLELNKEDGWNRKFILATNNENNICEKVTYERIKRVMTWYKNQKWEQVEWLWWNLTYLKNTFIDKHNSNDDLRLRMVARCSELLCLKENIWEEVKQKNDIIKLFKRDDKYLAILYDMFYFDEFKEVLNNLDKAVSIYAFSHYKLNKTDFEWLKIKFEIEQIPDPILEVYESIFWL